MPCLSSGHPGLEVSVRFCVFPTRPGSGLGPVWSPIILRTESLLLVPFAPLSLSLQKLQDMDERRATHLGAGYGLLSEAELQVVPIIAKCLEGMKVAADAVDAKNVSVGSWANGLTGGSRRTPDPNCSPPLPCRTPRSSSSCTSQALPALVTWNSKTSASP